MNFYETVLADPARGVVFADGARFAAAPWHLKYAVVVTGRDLLRPRDSRLNAAAPGH
jgi:hypothetical protein